MGAYFAGLLVALWAAAILFQCGMWIREVFSRHGGTGVGYWLPGATLTFSLPFLGFAVFCGAPLVLWIFFGIPAGMGAICLIEALVNDWRARKEVTAGLITLPIGGRR